MKKLESLTSKKFKKLQTIKGGKMATDPETGCVDNPDKCTGTDCEDTVSTCPPEGC